MNIEHIKILTETIKQAEESESFFDDNGFNIESFTHSCGTASCIGGYAVALAKDMDVRSGNLTGIAEDFEAVARDYLGLSYSEGVDLFYPEHDNWAEIDKNAAIKVLENLIETGVVDWSIVNDVSQD